MLVSVNDGADGKGLGWYEARFTAGITADLDDLTLDLKYHAHVFPTDAHDAVQEVGANRRASHRSPTYA